MQSPSAVSQESDGVAIFHVHRHSCQSGICFLQEGGCFQGYPAGHGAGSVVRATGVCIQGVLLGGEENREISTKNRYNSEVESPGTRTYINTRRSTACSKALTHKTCRLHTARYRPTERQNKSSPHTASILPSYVRLLKINSTALCKNSQPSVPASSLPA